MEEWCGGVSDVVLRLFFHSNHASKITKLALKKMVGDRRFPALFSEGDVPVALAAVKFDAVKLDGAIELAVDPVSPPTDEDAVPTTDPPETPVAFSTVLLVVWAKELHILTGIVVPSLTTSLNPTLIVWPRVVMAAPPAINVVEPIITTPFASTVRRSEFLVAVGNFVDMVVPSRMRAPVATL